MGALPEEVGPAEVYYNAEQSLKYSSNTRIIKIQRELAQKCVDLLELEEEGLILDIGCGSGLSGSVISENNHRWIGIDISGDMLKIAREEADALDYIRADMGEGLNFQPGTFDGVISVSAIQWLFQSYSSEHHPLKRIRRFLVMLYSVCRPNSRCVLQFYLRSQKNVELLREEAVRAGFNGGIHIENPETRNSKHFLVLSTGPVKRERKGRREKKTQRKLEEILLTKERLRRRGAQVPRDTKYTGRRRSRK
jgi:18S rRNA (guanine1575-N7)-methyltransferase